MARQDGFAVKRIKYTSMGQEQEQENSLNHHHSGTGGVSLPLQSSFPQQQRRRREDVKIVDPASDTCELTSQLTTTMVPDSTSSGALFMVQSFGNYLDIVTVEFSVNPIDTSDVQVQVFSRIGDFVGFNNKPDAWKLAANTTIQPSQYGLGTIIPVSSFQSITMQPQELRAFYVVLTTPVLQFTKAPPQASLGDVYQFDKILSVSVGAALPRYFGNDLIKDRIFNGRLHYTTKLKCVNAEVPTTVVYSFLVEKSAVDASFLSKLQNALETVLVGIFQSSTSFQQYKQQGRLTLESIQASPATYNGGCPIAWSSCSLASSVVTLKHLDVIDSGKLIYDMIQNNVTITDSLQSPLGVAAQYAGNISVSQSFVFTLKGVPENATLDAVQTSYFEQATLQFLQQAAQGLTSSTVLDVVVGGKLSPTRRNLREHQGIRFVQSSTGPTSVLQLNGQVFGMYVPPQNVPYFGDFIQSLFADNEQQYVQFLSYQAGGPGPIAESGRGKLFSDLFGVSTTESQSSSPVSSSGGGGVTPQTSSSGSTSSNLVRLWILAICVIIICCMLLWLVYHFAGGKSAQVRRQKRRTTKDISSSEKRRSKSSSKRTTFRDYVRKQSKRRRSRDNREQKEAEQGGNAISGDKESGEQENLENLRASSLALSKAHSGSDDNLKLSSDPTQTGSIREMQGCNLEALGDREKSAIVRTRSNSREHSSAERTEEGIAKAKSTGDPVEKRSTRILRDGSSMAVKERERSGGTRPRSNSRDRSLSCLPISVLSNDMSEITNGQSYQDKSKRPSVESCERGTTRMAEQRPSIETRPRSFSDGAAATSRESPLNSRRESNSSDRADVRSTDIHGKPPRIQPSEKVTSVVAKKGVDGTKSMGAVDSIGVQSAEPVANVNDETTRRTIERQTVGGMRSRSVSDGDETRAARQRTVHGSDFRNSIETLDELGKGKPPSIEKHERAASSVGSESLGSLGNELDRESSKGVRRRSMSDASRERSGSLPPRGRSREMSESVRARSGSCDRVNVLSEKTNSNKRSLRASGNGSYERGSDQECTESKRRRSVGDPPRERRSFSPRQASNEKNGEASNSLKGTSVVTDSSDRSSRLLDQGKSEDSARRMSVNDSARNRSGSLPPRSRSRERPETVASPRSNSCERTKLSASSRLLKDKVEIPATSQTNRSSDGIDRRVSPGRAPRQGLAEVNPSRSESSKGNRTEKKENRDDPKARMRQNKRARLKRAGLIKSAN